VRKKVILLYLLFVVLTTILSCGTKTEEKDILFINRKDDLGRTVKVKKEGKRFLPFAPSVTEMIYLVCDTTEIVGRTPHCNYPVAVFSKPVVNNYPPDLEKILFLHPDLLITKDGMLSLQQAAAIEKMGIPVYFQKYNSVEDIFKGFEELGEITNHSLQGKKVVDSLRKELEKYTKVSDSSNLSKKVLILISRESYFVYGKDTYASDILHLAGGENAVDSVYENSYPVLTSEYILKINPDIIVGGEHLGLTSDFFELHKELKRTNAYKYKQCFVINEDCISRPGPRVVEAVKMLRVILEKSKSYKATHDF
jgi:iron complex transport system substrate-binding protein